MNEVISKPRGLIIIIRRCNEHLFCSVPTHISNGIRKHEGESVFGLLLLKYHALHVSVHASCGALLLYWTVVLQLYRGSSATRGDENAEDLHVSEACENTPTLWRLYCSGALFLHWKRLLLSRTFLQIKYCDFTNNAAKSEARLFETIRPQRVTGIRCNSHKLLFA